MKTPDTPNLINKESSATALGATESLIRDRTTGAYMVQMEAKGNTSTKKLQKDQNKQLKQELSTKKKNLTNFKLLTEYINMSETAEHPTSRKALHGVWNEERMYITENDA